MANEKDRFGDTMRKKEKADEDRYFAEQDRERLERLRTESKKSAMVGMCPRCGIPLEQVDQDGINVDRCKQCSGIWLDAGELEEMEKRNKEPWMSRWIRSVLEH